ncbi:hypothetical protein N0V94_004340 [Neodidymelliopsis sp. IMI 364377]|nr:hypothetical protein N0V94_004340 [Neodidymelliopsis sp. IMI 364377]
MKDSIHEQKLQAAEKLFFDDPDECILLAKHNLARDTAALKLLEHVREQLDDLNQILKEELTALVDPEREDLWPAGEDSEEEEDGEDEDDREDKATSESKKEDEVAVAAINLPILEKPDPTMSDAIAAAAPKAPTTPKAVTASTKGFLRDTALSSMKKRGSRKDTTYNTQDEKRSKSRTAQDEDRGDDIAIEDNKGLTIEGGEVELESSAMSRSDLSMDACLLEFCAKFIPEEVQSVFTDTISKWAAHLKQTLPPQEEEEEVDRRFKSFKYGIGQLVSDLNSSTTFSVKELVDTPLEQWVFADEEIDRPFSKEEIWSFCCRLDMEGLLTFLPEAEDGASIVSGPKSKDNGKAPVK